MSDYLNREDLLKELDKEVEDADDWKTAHEIENVVKYFPSADVVEVRHGHWIAVTVSSGRDSWQCSECGRHARGKIENLPYCHCGARMDGKEQEHENNNSL